MYKTINGWTKESMKAQIKSRNNGKISVDKFGYCKYRGKNNNACAVGCFIPDEFYNRGFEGYLPHGSGPKDSLFDHCPELLFLMPLESDGLLAMQKVHDETAFHEENVHKELFAWIDENVVDGN